MAQSTRRDCVGAIGILAVLWRIACSRPCFSRLFAHPAGTGSGRSLRAAAPHALRPPPPLAFADAGTGGTSGFTVATVAAAGTIAAAAAASRRRTAWAAALQRRSRGIRRAYRNGGESRTKEALTDFRTPAAPGNLYELLKITPRAGDQDIKKAYYGLQKICHPDVAGPDGEEMCILLNDAYDVLTDKSARAAYDEQLQQLESRAIDKAPAFSGDLGPEWEWGPKVHNKTPVYSGRPRSRSVWGKRPPEERGEKHAQQLFCFVDEWQCISCRNCCDVAPKTFCIDIEHGRARAYSQWGDSEEYLDYAVSSCPVDCIYWVSREELQSLEHVTAEKMHHTKGGLPCPMAIRQGVYMGRVDDPFDMAEEFVERQRQQELRQQFVSNMQVAADKFQSRIMEVFMQLKTSLQSAGWGSLPGPR